MKINNSYEDSKRASAYARLEFPGTYYLAYRDLPQIISEHVGGNRAIDFGCGTGRSTRFLQQQGFETVGIDISAEMIRQARQFDGGGDYRLVENGVFHQLEDESFDLVLSAFTFDNIAEPEMKIKNLIALGKKLKPGGIMVNLVSAPEMYTHEWASFSTQDFPENNQAGSGDKVKIIITDINDTRPVVDTVWTDADYREMYKQSSFEILKTYKPLADKNDGYNWINETTTAPWVIYCLGRAAGRCTQ